MGLVERFRSWVARVFAPAPRCLICDGIAPAPSTACPDCLLYATESIRAPEGYLDPFDLPPSRLPDPRAAAVSFSSFIEQAFEVLGLELAPVHRRWCAAIDTGHARTVIDAPRGHGKSTIAVLLAIWEAWRNAESDVILVRGSYAGRSLSVETLNRFTRDLGMAGNAHNGSRIRVHTIAERRHGLHPQRVVCDDPEEELEGESAEYVRTMFASRVLNIVPPEGKITIIGTPGPDGFGLGRGPDTWSLRTPAIERGVSAWPSRFPLDRLERLRSEISEARFRREFLCLPPATGTPRGPELDAALRDAADGPQDAPKAPGGTSGADGLLEATEATLARATDGYDGPEG